MDVIFGIQSELSGLPLYKEMPHYLEALQAYEAAGFDPYNLSLASRVHEQAARVGTSTEHPEDCQRSLSCRPSCFMSMSPLSKESPAPANGLRRFCCDPSRFGLEHARFFCYPLLNTARKPMLQSLIKPVTLWGISKGLGLPQAPIDRVNELAFLKDLLQQLAVDCVLDVGANRGQFARELRGIGYDGPIVSFEPVQSEFTALARNFERDRKWRGFQIALGSKEDSLLMTIPELTVLSSLLELAGPERGCRRERVRVARLDEVLPSLQAELGFSRVFLKMDTQGYDLEVFKGSSGCMNFIQGIQSELSIMPLYKNMPHYLEALGAYEAAGFNLYNLSVVNRIGDGGLLELNCFMRKAS